MKMEMKQPSLMLPSCNASCSGLWRAGQEARWDKIMCINW